MLDGSISRMAGSRQEVYRSVLLGMVAASSVGPPASEDISRKWDSELAICVCKLLVLKLFFCRFFLLWKCVHALQLYNIKYP